MAGLKQETIFVTFLSGLLWEHGAVEGLNKAREMILFSVLAHWVVPLVWCCITMSFFWGGSLFFGCLQRTCLENSCLLDNGVLSTAGLETERSLLNQNVKILRSMQVEGRNVEMLAGQINL